MDLKRCDEKKSKKEKTRTPDGGRVWSLKRKYQYFWDREWLK